jgi:predicted RNA-binding protein with EMAP domain
MSDLIVEAVRIKKVLPHPNADKLEIVVVKNWNVVTAKNQFKTNDSVIFVPPDALVPQKLAEELG